MLLVNLSTLVRFLGSGLLVLIKIKTVMLAISTHFLSYFYWFWIKKGPLPCTQNRFLTRFVTCFPSINTALRYTVCAFMKPTGVLFNIKWTFGIKLLISFL